MQDTRILEFVRTRKRTSVGDAWPFVHGELVHLEKGMLVLVCCESCAARSRRRTCVSNAIAIIRNLF